MNRYWARFQTQRFNRRRVLATSGAGALGAALLTACGGSDDSGGGGVKGDTSGLLSPIVDDEKKAVRGGSFKYYHAFDQQSMDPMFTSLPNQLPVNSCYGQFWTYTGGHLKPSAGGIKGDVAESWEYSGDKMTLTFKLTDKAHFSPQAPTNGRVIDAQDVVFSWNRFKETGTRRFDLSNAIDPEAPVLSMSALDNRTVQVKLAKPFAGFEYLITNGQAGYMFMVPKEAEDINVVDLRREVRGTGPWYLDNYTTSVSYTFKRNPGFKQDDRGWPYMDEFVAPIVTEYAQQLAQFKTGAIYSHPALRAEDILPTKREISALEMYPNPLTAAYTRNFFGALPESPFKDERVRQAWTMSVDRDLFIDVILNVSKYEADGLPMQTAWDSALACSAWEGWWQDPKGQSWAPYYKQNTTEAKKLLTAAGFPNGVDANVRYPGTGYPDQYFKSIELYLGMVTESGFRPKQITVNFNSEWRPQLANAKGQFEGVSFIVDSGSSEPALNLFQHYHQAGSLSHGYDAEGMNRMKGDPAMNDLTARARDEFDQNKRKELVSEIQKYEAKKIYFPKVAGGANTFGIQWPAFRGQNVWQGALNRNFAHNWLDTTKAPFKT